MKNLQDRCVWKEISEVQIIAEGNLKECRKCDGYNKTCHAYYSTKEKQTKFRVYKMHNDTMQEWRM